MMKLLISMIVGAISTSAMAAQRTTVTHELLLKNLAIETQSFVTNTDGSRVLEVYGSLQTSRFAFQGKTHVPWSWETKIQGLTPLYLTYEVIIEDDMSIFIDVIQYESLKPKPTGVIRKARLPIKNFDSVTWVAKAANDKNIVVRFSPSLPTSIEPTALTYPVLALNDAILIDNSNRIWSRGAGGAGEVHVFSTPYGRLFISFVQFSDSKEIGQAEGDEIQLNLGPKLRVWVRSRETIVAGKLRVKVFGLLQENKRSRNGGITVLPADKVASEMSRPAN